MKNLFGQVVYDKLKALGTLLEVRLKVGFPILCFTPAGRVETDIEVSRELIDSILDSATHRSIYALNERMKQGYLPYGKGIRLGLCGEYVTRNGVVESIKDIDSIVVRLPGEIKGCSSCITDSKLFNNMIVASPPFTGKTTFLRDLAKRASAEYRTVVIDERNELAGGGAFDVGRADVICGLSKAFAYQYAVRSLSPEIIVTDEIGGAEETDSIKKVIDSGVKVYASMHASDDTIKFDKVKFDVLIKLSSSPIGKVREIIYG